MENTKIIQLMAVAAASVLVTYLAVSTVAQRGNQQSQSLDFPPVLTADAAAVDYFLKIDGIDGGSTAQGHQGAIEIMSYSWGMSNSGSFSSGGGAGAGKVSIGSIRFTTMASQASPMLFESVATGKHFPTIKLTAVNTGAEGQEFLTVTLSDVIISSYQHGGTSGELPADTFRLNFSKIEFEYKPQKADGSLDASVKAGWDLATNKKL